MIWTDTMLLVVVLVQLYNVHADYSCVCNHKVQANIYTTPSDQATPIGSIDAFDCVPIHGPIVDGFREIEFKQQIAYIKEDDQVKSQMCAGEKPNSNRVTTNSPDKTTQSTTLRSQTTLTNTAITPTSQTIVSTTPTPATTYSIQPVTSTTTKTTPPTASCPAAVTSSQYKRNTTIYGRSCYEIVAHSRTFNQSETDCTHRGGHLMHIQSAAEQDFITKYLQANYNHEVWVGLGDHAHEETWTWTSGVPLRYTHWDPSRKNFLLHGFEDCVVLEPSKQGYWDDRRCDGLFAAGHSYVCQYDAHSPVVIVG